MVRRIATREQFADLVFPQQGIDLSTGFSRQRQGTSPLGTNVRTFEPTTNRARGGQRPGLIRYNPVRPAGPNLIQDLSTLVGVGYAPPGGSMQQSSSGRVVTLVAVSGGNVYVAAPQGTGWTLVPNTTAFNPPLNTSGVVMSASNQQRLWFADGTHYCYFDPVANAVVTWAATAGVLPVDAAGNTPRLIDTWRGRTVLSGLLKDPQNWFMSAVSTPTDFNYAPALITPTQAVAGNNSPLGFVGDVITSLVPYSDDLLIIGGDHTIWTIRGDPNIGGQIDRLSDSIGMAWGRPWCRGPDGTLYFVSNRTGIYSLMPGQGPPVRMSQQIEQLINVIDTGSYTIRLIWDDRFQGLHVFITNTNVQGLTNHYFWEARAGAWWQDQFANIQHNPLTCTVFDGNAPGDRVPLIGSWDGYVRSIDPTATSDDGTAIQSSVVLGPLLTGDLDEMLLKDLQAVLGASSGSVSYAVYIGATAEIALAQTPVATGTWNAGRNLTNLVRRAGHAVYVQISASNPWALESIRARIASQGKVRRRGV